MKRIVLLVWALGFLAAVATGATMEWTTPIEDLAGGGVEGVGAWQQADIEADRARAEAQARIASAMESQAAMMTAVANAVNAQTAALEKLAAEVAALAARVGDVAVTVPPIELRAELKIDTAALEARLGEIVELMRAPPDEPDVPDLPDEPLDLNTATIADLTRLPGIGETMAARIVSRRPYLAVEDLLRVVGIGPATLAEIRPYVIVTEPDAETLQE